MVNVDSWLNARFALMTDPWDCIIGAYGAMIDTFGLTEDQAFEKIKQKCQEYLGPDGICREYQPLLYGGLQPVKMNRPGVCNGKGYGQT